MRAMIYIADGPRRRTATRGAQCDMIAIRASPHPTRSQYKTKDGRIEQKTVLFYEDDVTAVIIDADGRRQVYIPLRSICDRLGLDWSAQTRRINRDEILAEEVLGVAVMTTPSPDGRGGGIQEMLCLPLEMLNGWLFGINASRVNNDIRPALLRYQRECYRVLYKATQEGRLSADVGFDELLTLTSADTVEAYQ